MRSVVAVLKTGFSGLTCPPPIRRNIGYYGYQQVRFVSLSSKIVCWNCKKPGKQMICVDCGSLQDVDDKIASNQWNVLMHFNNSINIGNYRTTLIYWTSPQHSLCILKS